MITPSTRVVFFVVALVMTFAAMAPLVNAASRIIA